MVCESEAATWLDWLDERRIGWAAWKLDGCSDTTCFFKDQTVPPDGNWTSDDLNGHAEFVISRMRGASGEEPPTVDDCTPSGSCATGDGMDCVDGALTPRDCSGCAVLSCGVDCCDSIGYFGAITYPDYATDMDLVTGFAQSSTAVEIPGSFTSSDQLAAIAFSLSSAQPIDPYDISLTLDAFGDFGGTVSVSLEDGDAAGRLYDVSGSSGVYWLYYQVSCWGGFGYDSPVRQINVRLESYEAGEATLTVTGIDL